MLPDFEESFEVLYQDAIANFDTSRFKDSAKGFQYLSELCIKNKYVEDSIYFAYRTAIAYKSAELDIELIKLYRNIGVFFLKHTAELINKLEDKENIDLLNVYQSTLKILGKPKLRKQVVHRLISLYLDEIKITPMKKDYYLEKAIKLSVDIHDNKLTRKLVTRLANYFLDEKDKILQQEIMDADIIARKYMEKAIKLYESIDNNSVVIKLQDEMGEL